MAEEWVSMEAPERAGRQPEPGTFDALLRSDTARSMISATAITEASSSGQIGQPAA